MIRINFNFPSKLRSTSCYFPRSSTEHRRVVSFWPHISRVHADFFGFCRTFEVWTNPTRDHPPIPLIFITFPTLILKPSLHHTSGWAPTPRSTSLIFCWKRIYCLPLAITSELERDRPFKKKPARELTKIIYRTHKHVTVLDHVWDCARYTYNSMYPSSLGTSYLSLPLIWSS